MNKKLIIMSCYLFAQSLTYGSQLTLMAIGILHNAFTVGMPLVGQPASNTVAFVTDAGKKRLQNMFGTK